MLDPRCLGCGDSTGCGVDEGTESTIASIVAEFLRQDGVTSSRQIVVEVINALR
jgi:hypothetical protein